jgi:hypothetical protein
VSVMGREVEVVETEQRELFCCGKVWAAFRVPTCCVACCGSGAPVKKTPAGRRDSRNLKAGLAQDGDGDWDMTPVTSVPMQQTKFQPVSASPAAGRPAVLPAGWEELKTADGQSYFLNSRTNTTTWYALVAWLRMEARSKYLLLYLLLFLRLLWWKWTGTGLYRPRKLCKLLSTFRTARSRSGSKQDRCYWEQVRTAKDRGHSPARVSAEVGEMTHDYEAGAEGTYFAQPTVMNVWAQHNIFG